MARFSLPPQTFRYICKQNVGKRKQRLARAEMKNREEEETRVGTSKNNTGRSIISLSLSLEQEEHELEFFQSGARKSTRRDFCSRTL